MNDAREIIAKAISGAPFPSARSLTKAQSVIDALTTAGYRILGPDEVDPVTVEKCAEIADERYEGHSVAFGTMRARNYEHAGSTIAAAIRAIGRKA